LPALTGVFDFLADEGEIKKSNEMVLGIEDRKQMISRKEHQESGDSANLIIYRLLYGLFSGE